MTTATTAKPAETQTPTGNGTEQATANGDGSELTAAFWQAINKRNKTKGDIPAAQLTALKAAYAKTAPLKRTNLVKNLRLEAADRILNDKGEFDASIAHACKILGEAIDAIRAETTRTERPAHDPVADVARAIHALRQWETELLAGLTDDQRKAVTKFKVDPADEATKDAKGRVDKALTSLRNAAVNGRTGYTGKRTSASDIAAKIRAAVDKADHPLTFAEMKEATGLPQATIYTRWTKTKTTGVKTSKDKQGRMVFAKDPKAA